MNGYFLLKMKKILKIKNICVYEIRETPMHEIYSFNIM